MRITPKSRRTLYRSVPRAATQQKNEPMLVVSTPVGSSLHPLTGAKRRTETGSTRCVAAQRNTQPQPRLPPTVAGAQNKRVLSAQPRPPLPQPETCVPLKRGRTRQRGAIASAPPLNPLFSQPPQITRPERRAHSWRRPPSKPPPLLTPFGRATCRRLNPSRPLSPAQQPCPSDFAAGRGKLVVGVFLCQ